MNEKNKKNINKKSLILIIFSVILMITFVVLIGFLFINLRVPTYSERYAKQISALKTWHKNEYQKEYENQENKIDLSNYNDQQQAIINSYVKNNYEKFINDLNEVEKYYKYNEKSFQIYDYDTENLAFDVEKIKSYKKDNIVNQSITRSNIINSYDQLDTFIFEKHHWKKYDYQASNNKLFITRVLNPRLSLHYETDYAYSFTNLTDENQYIIVRQNDFRLMFEENKNRYPELTNFIYGRAFVPEHDKSDEFINDIANTKWNVDYTSSSYWDSNNHKFIGQESDWFYQYKQQYVLPSATMGLRWHLLTDHTKYDTFSVVDRTTQDKWNAIFPNTYPWKNHSLASDVIQIKPKEKIYLLAMFDQLPFNLYKVNTNGIYDDNSNWQAQHESMFYVRLCLKKGECNHPLSNVQNKWNDLLNYISYDRQNYKNHDEVIQAILNYLEYCKFGFRLMLSPGYKSQFLNIKIRPYLVNSQDSFKNFKKNILVKNKWKMSQMGWPSEIKDNIGLYYSFHNINGLYEFYRKTDLQIKDKFKFLVYFITQKETDDDSNKVVAYTEQLTEISDDYRFFNINNNYNINFNFTFNQYYKDTPYIVQNKLRTKSIDKWGDDDFNQFFKLFDNHKKLYTEVGDENTVFYHEYTHILGQDHENINQRLNMDQTAFGYLPVFSHEIIYI